MRLLKNSDRQQEARTGNGYDSRCPVRAYLSLCRVELVAPAGASAGPQVVRAVGCRAPSGQYWPPRTPLAVLLVGVLQMLRNGLTLAKSAAVAGCSEGTLAGYYKELLGMIAALGVVQADGTWLTSEELTNWLAEMAEAGELVCVDGTWTRCPKPSKWLAQKPFYDSKHKIHAYNTQVLATQHGDVLAVHGGWPGRVTEAEQLRYSDFAQALRDSGVRPVTDRGYRPAREDMRVLCAAGNHRTPQPGDREITAVRPECERAVSLLKNWQIMQRTRLGWATHHLVTAAVAVLVGIQTYGHRTPEHTTLTNP